MGFGKTCARGSRSWMPQSYIPPRENKNPVLRNTDLVRRVFLAVTEQGRPGFPKNNRSVQRHLVHRCTYIAAVAANKEGRLGQGTWLSVDVEWGDSVCLRFFSRYFRLLPPKKKSSEGERTDEGKRYTPVNGEAGTGGWVNVCRVHRGKPPDCIKS